VCLCIVRLNARPSFTCGGAQAHTSKMQHVILLMESTTIAWMAFAETSLHFKRQSLDIVCP
jgi:hypothetical protein